MTQRQQFLHRHLFALVAAASVLAATSIFYISQVSQNNGEDMEANNFRKLLSLEQYLDPKTVKKAPLHLAPTPKTLTIVHFDPSFPRPHYFSIFTTGTLDRYGTGRVKYEQVTNREVNHAHAPCLAVLTHHKDRPDLDATMTRAEQRRFRQCKMMVTADEFCGRTDVDAREYYTKDAEELAYLPLGPRDDTWESFKNVAAESPSKMIEIIPASQRKHKINGIFSANTNHNREVLSSVLDSHPDENEELNAFLQISKQWHSSWNTDEYVKVLLDSTFTLSPIGHNPECFRLFEAVEAGSIPIVVLDEDYYTHPCNEALDPWFKAPIVFLNSWDDLYHWVNHHLANPVALDKQQAELREWYDNHMRTTVSKFELFMLNELDTMSQEAEEVE